CWPTPSRERARWRRVVPSRRAGPRACPRWRSARWCWPPRRLRPCDPARRGAAEAAALHDERLATLAGELQRTLRRLAAGDLSDGDALEKLAALQRQAAAAAEQAARESQAFEAVKKALAEETATRGAGEALTNQDGDDGARARAALGAAAANNPTDTARALAAAARGIGSALGAQNNGDDNKN